MITYLVIAGITMFILTVWMLVMDSPVDDFLGAFAASILWPLFYAFLLACTVAWSIRKLLGR